MIPPGLDLPKKSLGSGQQWDASNYFFNHVEYAWRLSGDQKTSALVIMRPGAKLVFKQDKTTTSEKTTLPIVTLISPEDIELTDIQIPSKYKDIWEIDQLRYVGHRVIKIRMEASSKQQKSASKPEDSDTEPKLEYVPPWKKYRKGLCNVEDPNPGPYNEGAANNNIPDPEPDITIYSDPLYQRPVRLITPTVYFTDKHDHILRVGCTMDIYHSGKVKFTALGDMSKPLTGFSFHQGDDLVSSAYRLFKFEASVGTSYSEADEDLSADTLEIGDSLPVFNPVLSNGTAVEKGWVYRTGYGPKETVIIPLVLSPELEEQHPGISSNLEFVNGILGPDAQHMVGFNQAPPKMGVFYFFSKDYKTLLEQIDEHPITKVHTSVATFPIKVDTGSSSVPQQMLKSSTFSQLESLFKYPELTYFNVTDSIARMKEPLFEAITSNLGYLMPSLTVLPNLIWNHPDGSKSSSSILVSQGDVFNVPLELLKEADVLETSALSFEGNSRSVAILVSPKKSSETCINDKDLKEVTFVLSAKDTTFLNEAIKTGSLNEPPGEYFEAFSDLCITQVDNLPLLNSIKLTLRDGLQLICPLDKGISYETPCFISAVLPEWFKKNGIDTSSEANMKKALLKLDAKYAYMPNMFIPLFDLNDPNRQKADNWYSPNERTIIKFDWRKHHLFSAEQPIQYDLAGYIKTSEEEIKYTSAISLPEGIIATQTAGNTDIDALEVASMNIDQNTLSLSLHATDEEPAVMPTLPIVAGVTRLRLLHPASSTTTTTTLDIPINTCHYLDTIEIMCNDSQMRQPINLPLSTMTGTGDSASTLPKILVHPHLLEGSSQKSLLVSILKPPLYRGDTFPQYTTVVVHQAYDENGVLDSNIDSIIRVGNSTVNLTELAVPPKPRTPQKLDLF